MSEEIVIKLDQDEARALVQHARGLVLSVRAGIEDRHYVAPWLSMLVKVEAATSDREGEQ